MPRQPQKGDHESPQGNVALHKQIVSLTCLAGPTNRSLLTR